MIPSLSLSTDKTNFAGLSKSTHGIAIDFTPRNIGDRPGIEIKMSPTNSTEIPQFEEALKQKKRYQA